MPVETAQPHPLVVGTNLAGVEIELEGIDDIVPSFKYWDAKGDGSLRNYGMEFVCNQPWGGKDLYCAGVEIDKWLSSQSPEDSWRCSTHVHVDVRDMTVDQLKRMILAYAMYERILFRCSGMHRYKNNFCVALGFAQDLITQLSLAWQENDRTFLNTVIDSWDKYSSINLLPLAQFGSVEFRISEAKWRKGRLIRLVNRFLSLKEIAMQTFDGSESDFIEMLYNTPVTDMIKKGLPRNIKNFESDLDLGYKLSHDILSLGRMRRSNKRMLTPNPNHRTRYEFDFGQENWAYIASVLPTISNYRVPTTPPDFLEYDFVNKISKLFADNGSAFSVGCLLRGNTVNDFLDWLSNSEGSVPRESEDSFIPHFW